MLMLQVCGRYAAIIIITFSFATVLQYFVRSWMLCTLFVDAVIDNGSSSQVSEVLRRQREEAAKLVEDEDEAYDDDHRLEMVTADDRLQLSRRTRHSDNEPIVPKQPYELHQNPSVKAPTRKVTTTVKTPAYKGDNV